MNFFTYGAMALEGDLPKSSESLHSLSVAAVWVCRHPPDSLPQFLVIRRPESLPQGYHPGKWSIVTETMQERDGGFAQTAVRGLQEEIFSSPDRSPIWIRQVTEVMQHRGNPSFAFQCFVAQVGEVCLNPKEVTDHRWMTLSELGQEAELNANIYIPDFAWAVKMLQDVYEQFFLAGD